MHFDSTKDFILAYGANSYGLESVFSHVMTEDDHTIAFTSRPLTKAEKNYSCIEKEALDMVFEFD